jgi:preprotein translocase subunit SecA
VSYGGAEAVDGDGAAALVEREPELAEAGTAPSGRSRAQRRGNSHDRGTAAARPRNAERQGEHATTPRAPWAGTGRNAPCPCGSGKKFKHCHGRL